MSALIVKSVNRLYKLFKVYTTLAVIGALMTILVEIIIAWPLVLIATFMVAAFASTVVLIWAQSSRRSLFQKHWQKAQADCPPKLPESLMAASLPIEMADDILGDLACEFYRLRSRYSRSSAVTWYTIQSASIFIRATAMHLGLNRDKGLTQFLKKESS